jgi:sugar phosphate isomerase/epimerase
MINKFGIVLWAFPFMGPYMGKLAKDAGLDGMELELGNWEEGFFLANREVQDGFLEIREKFGLEYPSLAVNTLCFHGLTNEYNSGAGAIVMKAIETAVSVASAMGIPKIQLPSFDDGAIKTDKDLENTALFLKKACELAAGDNILICSENSLSMAENRKLFELVNAANFKLFFDTQNYALLKGYKPSQMILELRDLIIETHIKDGIGEMSNRLLGDGDSGFIESMGALKKINYSGWFLLENYYHKAPLNTRKESFFELLKIDLAAAKAALTAK